MSKKGMFVITKQPFAKGRKLKFLVEIEQCMIPLSGTVMWTRLQAETDRPVGMGVRFAATPAIYRHYVMSLNPQEQEDDEEPAPADDGASTAADPA